MKSSDLLRHSQLFQRRHSVYILCGDQHPRSPAVHLIYALLMAFFIFGLPQSAMALPGDIAKFEIVEGGLSDIRDGATVEGSTRTGGAQPDYTIDLHAEPLRSLMARAEEIGKSNLAFWNKVESVVQLVSPGFFNYFDYNNPFYRRLMKRFRDEGRDVPLSQYGVCSAGVCREYALVLHFALKAAGISNLHGYAEIYRASRYHNFEITEDHAFTVVQHEGEDWVVDSYYWGFNGYRLKDLLSPEGITEHSPHAPFAVEKPGTRRILKINSFPRIFNPRPGVLRCTALFAG